MTFSMSDVVSEIGNVIIVTTTIPITISMSLIGTRADKFKILQFIIVVNSSVV
jgi:hypothetical protein